MHGATVVIGGTAQRIKVQQNNFTSGNSNITITGKATDSIPGSVGECIV
jgi:hypothetical protein